LQRPLVSPDQNEGRAASSDAPALTKLLIEAGSENAIGAIATNARNRVLRAGLSTPQPKGCSLRRPTINDQDSTIWTPCLKNQP
jgi:hypothetical protein